MKSIAVTYASGATGIITPDDPNVSPEAAEAIVAQFVEIWSQPNKLWQELNLVPIQGWRFIDEATIPADRSFRDAWVDTGSTVAHDMPKARNIYRARARVDRAPALAALDVDYQRADEAEDRAAKRAIGLQKQRLRDAPADPRIEACATIEELRALDVLTEPAARRNP